MLKDCAPDVWRGFVPVCRWGGEVVVGGAEAGGAEGGVAVGCGGLFSLFRVVPVCLVILLCWDASKACGPSACDVGVGVMCQGLAPLDGGDQDLLVLGVLVSPPEGEVHDGLVEASPRGGVWSRRPSTMSLDRLSCQRYQPRGVSRSLSWRVLGGGRGR